MYHATKELFINTEIEAKRKFHIFIYRRFIILKIHYLCIIFERKLILYFYCKNDNCHCYKI